MTIRLMRPSLPSRLVRAPARYAAAAAPAAVKPAAADSFRASRGERSTSSGGSVDLVARDVWFSSTVPRLVQESGPGGDHPPPDERSIKLGRTVRILHDRLPSLLASPLPQEILSPQISLHLFPSTHPHLPTVSGRIAYLAALWTAPVAWGRVPVVGNVRLTVLSERMVKNGGHSVPASFRDEKLIVKWKSCGKEKKKNSNGLYRGIGANEQVERITQVLGGSARDDEEFCGLFIFEFDEDGRIVKHTIEHAEEGGSSDRTNRVVSVTDWLLGKVSGHRDEPVPGLAWCESGQRRRGPSGRRD